MKQSRWLTRALSALLCAALLLCACPLTLFAEEGETEEETQAVVQLAQGDEEEVLLNSEGKPVNFLDKVFRYFNWFGFSVDPDGKYIVSQQPAWQWVGGFNELFDAFAWVALAYPDSMRCKFTYGGKEWMLQFWKGSFVYCLTIGGEVGVYNRPEGSKVNHYFSATMDDYLNMTMSIYHKTARLFTRPWKAYWWCTGFMPKLTLEMFNKPRKNVVMDATIEMKDAEMAALFIACLEEKGFVSLDTWDEGARMGLRTPDTYDLDADGVTVRMIWQNYTENWY